MPDTRPGSIFNSDGVCQACLNFDQRKLVNWDARLDELETLCDNYRKNDGTYDCIIAVSGGKDSHFLTYLMKERMGMNPLLISVTDPFTHTDAGTHNFRNLGDSFNCDIVSFSMSIDLFKRVTRIGFEELGEPLRFIEAVIYTAPYKYAVAFNIPLLVYGENAAFTYGTTKDDHSSVEKYIEAGHSASGEKLAATIASFWRERGIPLPELNAIIPPSTEEIAKVNPEPFFMSYFFPWDDEYNYEIAKRYGFRDLHHEWKREGFIDNYGQIDSIAYILHLWMKYPKFGFSRVTDITSRWIRKGIITREDAKRLIMEHDHKLDQRALDDFITLLGYSAREYWDVVEKYWNPALFNNTNGIWRLKSPVYADLVESGT